MADRALTSMRIGNNGYRSNREFGRKIVAAFRRLHVLSPQEALGHCNAYALSEQTILVPLNRASQTAALPQGPSARDDSIFFSSLAVRRVGPKCVRGT